MLKGSSAPSEQAISLSHFLSSISHATRQSSGFARQHSITSLIQRKNLLSAGIVFSASVTRNSTSSDAKAIEYIAPIYTPPYQPSP